MFKEIKGTLLLGRNDVERLLTLDECVRAVEDAFRLQGEGKLPPSGILGVHAPGGGLHVKAGLLPRRNSYIVAKLNSNFPGNSQSGLPTIQGVIVVYDAENGRPLAVLDSIDVTLKRTAAASAVAAKYLARADSSVLTVYGCGQQSRAQLCAIHSVLKLKKIYAFDLRTDTAKSFATGLQSELGIDIEAVPDPRAAIRKSDVCVTCTTASKFIVSKDDVAPGIFIAAVGADDAHKQEIDPQLLAAAKVVADNLDQCCVIGDTHHAIAAGLMQREDVYAELGEIVAGKKPGRTGDEEIIVFDSTGVAFEDAVAAATVYERALAKGIGTRFDFAD